MNISTIGNKCVGCMGCKEACGNEAISFGYSKTGFLYPVIDEEKCADCGACLVKCPAAAEIKGTDFKCFSLRCNDEGLLQKSTSGGAFSIIANEVLADGGMVCGAVYDENFHVKHVISTDITAMRKSKYVQSDMSGIYSSIKAALSEGKTVLFSGTPCQCHAVKLAFENEDKLLTASIMCRGVQAPKFWEDYKAYLEKDGELKSFCSRAKLRLDDAHMVTYTVGDNNVKISFNEDKFHRIYTKLLSLRTSCYACKYTRFDNDFDFTIGDFWGVEKVYPELADGKGTSLVIARGERAEMILENAKKSADIRPVNKEEAAQPCLVAPAKAPMLKRVFDKELEKRDEKGRYVIDDILKKFGN